MNAITNSKNKGLVQAIMLVAMLATIFVLIPEAAMAGTSLVTGAQKIGKELKDVGQAVIIIGFGLIAIALAIGWTQAASKIVFVIIGGGLLFGATSLTDFLKSSFA